MASVRFLYKPHRSRILDHTAVFSILSSSPFFYSALVAIFLLCQHRHRDFCIESALKMAPHQHHHGTRLNRRRRNLQILPGLPAVAVKRFNCVICRSKHSTKQALKTHFSKVHKALPKKEPHRFLRQITRLHPFTDPSCWPQPGQRNLSWDDITAFRAQQQRLGENEPGSQASTAEHRQWGNEWILARSFAHNEAELEEVEEVRKLRIWNWWFHAQVATDFGPPVLHPDDRDDVEMLEEDDNSNMARNMIANEPTDFNILGDARLEDRKSRYAKNTVHLDVDMPEEPTVDYSEEHSRLDNWVAQPTASVRSDALEFWRPWIRRGGRTSRKTPDCELPLEGPLNPEATLQLLSEAITEFVQRQGETKDSREKLRDAARQYVNALAFDLDDPLIYHYTYLSGLEYQDFRQRANYLRMGPIEVATRQKKQDIWYADKFQADRIDFYNALGHATFRFFRVFDPEQITRGTQAFEQALAAVDGFAKELGAEDIPAGWPEDVSRVDRPLTVREKLHMYRGRFDGNIGWMTYLKYRNRDEEGEPSWRR